MRRLVLSTLITLGLGSAAMAENLAIIIANDAYRNYPSVPAARNIANLSDEFERAGYRVNVIRNTSTVTNYDNSNELLRRMRNADKLAILVAGQVVSTRGQNWLLHSDARRLTALTIGQNAVPLEPFLGLLGRKPGEALMVLADGADKLDLGELVSHQARIRGVPQGVTLVEGPPRPVATFIAQDLLRPGQSVAASKGFAPNGVEVAGFVPRSLPVVSAGPSGPTPAQIERSYWDEVKRRNTVAAFQDYLRRYPNGRFAAEASRRKDELSLTPQDRARIAEEGLGLSRDQRRGIQRQLTLIGFDTRGVDGVFGRNTRSAIARWQASVGNSATGYLSANQINRIAASAAARAQELRREAERRRAEAERKDRNYWAQTGAGGTENGLQAYLQRYPDGIYSQAARDQLKAIERERRREAKLAERQAWDQAVMGGTAESYAAYLNAYPNGLFANEARARFEALQNPETPQDLIDAARAEEQRLSLNTFTRQLIEAQLHKLNLDPGPVDGTFTKKTRRALRQYQRASNETVTGFVTRNTIVTLLASAID